MVTVEDSYETLVAFAAVRSLDTLVHDDDFVRVVHGKYFDATGDSDLRLAEILTDMFHDRFGLNSTLRKDVAQSIIHSKRTIT